LTHAHPDHLGGNTDGLGNSVYPNARHVLQRAEWDDWTSGAAMQSAINAQFIAFARHNLDSLGERLTLIEGETEIVPGIYAIATPGHTPGHMAVAIVSGDEQLLYISDAALHPIHLEHPDWHPGYDLEPAEAV